MITPPDIPAIRARHVALLNSIRTLCLAAHTRPDNDYRQISSEIIALTTMHDASVNDVTSLIDYVATLESQLAALQDFCSVFRDWEWDDNSLP